MGYLYSRNFYFFLVHRNALHCRDAHLSAPVVLLTLIKNILFVRMWFSQKEARVTLLHFSLFWSDHCLIFYYSLNLFAAWVKSYLNWLDDGINIVSFVLGVTCYRKLWVLDLIFHFCITYRYTPIMNLFCCPQELSKYSTISGYHYCSIAKRKNLFLWHVDLLHFHAKKRVCIFRIKFSDKL